MPPVDHVEFSTYLITDPSRRSLGVKYIQVLSGIKLPIRVNRVLVEIQDGSQIVVENRVDIKATGDTAGIVSDWGTALGDPLQQQSGGRLTVFLFGTNRYLVWPVLWRIQGCLELCLEAS